MKALFAVALLLSTPVAARTQNERSNSNSGDPSQASVLSQLKKQADKAHANSDINGEIGYRQKLTQEAWAAFSRDPHSLDIYERYNMVFFNDLTLGLLLEGTHKFSDAEVVFRHNQVELAREPIAGNDIKSENDLHLAHLLAREGNSLEAEKICFHWKSRMKRIPGRQDSAHIYGIPVAPVYNTAEVEKAKWDLACGHSDEGLQLIAEQITAHPHMLASFSALRNYYYAQGDFEKALQAESDGTFAVTGRH